MQEELPPESMNEILDLIFSGQKVAACKRYMELRDREFDDMPSILEAKNFIEQLTDELREKYPERFTNSNAGCLAVCLPWVALLGGGLWWLCEGWV